MNVEPLFRWSAFAWSAAALALLAMLPDVALEGFGNHRLPAVIHAFSLGAFVNGYYGMQSAVWQRVYRRPPPWPGLAVGFWALHQAGVLFMLAGFLRAGLTVTTLGAHYLVPTGLAMHAAQGGLALRRRPPGTPRHLGSQVPMLGMLVAMALGAMIVLDQATGRYGLFNPPTLLVHGLAGAFLFLLPALRLHGALQGGNSADAEATRRATAGVLVRTVPLALGVMMIATGLAPGAQGIALPGGLALIGATLLWGALPMAPRPVADPLGWMRMAWGVPGVLLLFSAIRSLRGMEPAEAFLLAQLGAVAVVLVAGLPELALRLTATGTGSPSSPGTLRGPAPGGALMVGAGALVLAGQMLGWAQLIQIGAAISLLGLVCAVLCRNRRLEPPAKELPSG